MRGRINQRTEALKDASRLDLIIGENFALLDIRIKARFDAIRIICSNMFAGHASPVRITLTERHSAR